METKFGMSSTSWPLFRFNWKCGNAWKIIVTLTNTILSWLTTWNLLHMFKSYEKKKHLWFMIWKPSAMDIWVLCFKQANLVLALTLSVIQFRRFFRMLELRQRLWILERGSLRNWKEIFCPSPAGPIPQKHLHNLHLNKLRAIKPIYRNAF